jgi:hypothetical protein
VSRKARALPSTASDANSVSTGAGTGAGVAERWRALFGSAPPHMSVLLAQAIAWREQVTLHGDVSPAIARDLAIVARQASEARGRTAALEQPDADAASAIDLLHGAADATVPAAPCSSATLPAPALAAAPRSRSRAASAPLLPASSQIVPGARLVKAYGGKTHVVEVIASGFLYEGVLYASLSAVAKHITGTHWNGLLFFGLRRRKTYPAKEARRG